ncbi:hypothetical protein Tco_1559599 [Tanacetum coccineum]
MIDVYNVSHEEIRKDLFVTNHPSGSTTSFSPSLHISKTSGYFLEEFADELAHITFPPGNDDLPFDAKYDLLELEYLLNHDPIKDMDSILKDLVDENSLDDHLDDTISEMFTDEHALDYSSPPLWNDYDDNLFDHETVNDDTYDDPFDFKEEKIKESKLLIDELDLPKSNNVLLFPEYDSVIYEDFFEVDALPSTNNKDKDFNPPLYELPFYKEVPGLGALLSFSPENKEKVYNPRILTSKRVHTSLLPELSHRGTKAFKVTKILESPMEIFLAFTKRTSVPWMFRVSTSIPLDQLKIARIVMTLVLVVLSSDHSVFTSSALFGKSDILI